MMCVMELVQIHRLLLQHLLEDILRDTCNKVFADMLQVVRVPVQ